MLVFNKVKSVIYFITRMCEYVGWFIILGWVIVMFVGTITRYFFRYPLIFQSDLVSVALVVFCTLCFPAIFLAGEHIRVELFTKYLPNKIQNIIWLFAELIFFAFSLLIVYSSFGLISHAIAVDSHMDVSNIPELPFILCIPIGFSLLSLAILIDFCTRINEIKKSQHIDN